MTNFKQILQTAALTILLTMALSFSACRSRTETTSGTAGAPPAPPTVASAPAAELAPLTSDPQPAPGHSDEHSGCALNGSPRPLMILGFDSPGARNEDSKAQQMTASSQEMAATMGCVVSSIASTIAQMRAIFGCGDGLSAACLAQIADDQHAPVLLIGVLKRENITLPRRTSAAERRHRMASRHYFIEFLIYNHVTHGSFKLATAPLTARQLQNQASVNDVLRTALVTLLSHYDEVGPASPSEPVEP